jgi:hypothetical protein
MGSHYYHRNNDPDTSKSAAQRLNLAIRNKHIETLRVLFDLDEATDDQIASESVARGFVKRHEEARRAIRTIRDRTDLIIPAISDNGTQKTFENESGRDAYAWTLSATGIRYTLDTPLSA